MHPSTARSDMPDLHVKSIRKACANAGTDFFVTHLGGEFGLKSEGEVIADIGFGFNSYFIMLGTQRFPIEVARGIARKFLKTTIDAYRPDTLLSLPEYAVEQSTNAV